MHLEGMHNILQSHGLSDTPPPLDATTSIFRHHLLEVMGVMDISCFSVGRQLVPSKMNRQGSSIGIWRRYCQPSTSRRGVEPVSGLPRSLLDLFAGIGIDTTEQSFWSWSGETGSFMQYYLWEAHRLAGILSLRRHSSILLKNTVACEMIAPSHPKNCSVDATTLVARILANLDALRLACAERPEEDRFIKNAILYPLFVAGLEIRVMCKNVQWQKTIQNCFLGSRQDQILLDLLQEMWTRADPDLNVDDLARERQMEMGLL